MFRARGLSVAAVSVALLFAGCGSDHTPTETQEKASEAEPLKVSMNPGEPESSLPAGCALSEIQALFTEFLEGGNEREASKLIRRVAPQPELNAFTLDGAGPNGHGSHYGTPRAVYEFFAGQSSLGYTRHLRQAEVSRISPGPNPTSPFRRPASGPAADDPVVGIGFALDLEKDGEPLTVKPGKGAINCETGRFYVYNGG